VGLAKEGNNGILSSATERAYSDYYLSVVHLFGKAGLVPALTMSRLDGESDIHGHSKWKSAGPFVGSHWGLLDFPKLLAPLPFTLLREQILSGALNARNCGRRQMPDASFTQGGPQYLTSLCGLAGPFPSRVPVKKIHQSYVGTWNPAGG